MVSKRGGGKTSLNFSYLRINSRRTVFCVGSTRFVLLAWHLNVEFKLVRRTPCISIRFVITLSFVSIRPSTSFSFTNQLTVGSGFPAINEENDNHQSSSKKI